MDPTTTSEPTNAATPRWAQSLPLRWTLAAAALLFAAAVLLVLGIGWQANRALANRTLSGLDAEARALQTEFERGGLDRLIARLEDISSTAAGGLYALETADGQRLAGNLPIRHVRPTMPGDGGVFTYALLDGQPERLAVGRRIRIALDGARTVSLLIARDIEDQRSLARAIQRTAVLGLGLISLLALGLGLLARRVLLERLGAITATSRSIMAGNLSERVPRDQSGDEFDRLSANLNDMLARIESLMQALREVSDNIAHDLRTPINRLRNTAEAALRSPADGAAHRDGLERVIEEADGLIKTFNALLLIARLEPGTASENLEMIDVAALVEDVAELYEPVAEEAGLSLTVLPADGDASIRANRQLLGQALSNLIDNAIKYSQGAGATGYRPSHGPVELAVRRSGDAVEIAVSDCGPGIAPEDRERALKRFVRLEESRSQPGTGLGLSLVSAVVRMHRGTLRLEDNAPGLRVVVRLPVG